MLCGIFAGGQARRMGGIAKGLLPTASGEAVVVRLARVAREAALEPVWIGLRENPHAEAYRSALPLREIDDLPRGIGPVGGLGGLLNAAQGHAIALACDLPFVSMELLVRLRQEHPEAEVLAARNGAFWEPFCARYQVRPLDAGVRSFQRLFSSLNVQELALSEQERTQLLDWDEPGDVPLHEA